MRVWPTRSICVQLGGTAIGTSRVVAKTSALPEYPLQITSGHDHVMAAATVLAAFGKSARAGIDQSDEMRDKATADLFTDISRGVDKWLWMVEAHCRARSSVSSA